MKAFYMKIRSLINMNYIGNGIGEWLSELNLIFT